VVGYGGPVASDLTTFAPHRVRPVMEHTWEDLTFVHWAYPPESVRPLVDPRLEIDTFDGQAWVAMTPFRLTVRPPAPWLPPFPGLDRVPETNLRTYVRDSSGRHGIWFFSLDIARLAAAALARATYSLPYRWAEMSVESDGQAVRYSGTRKPPDRASYTLSVDTRGEELPLEGRDELVDFLTARWRLYTVVLGRLLQARVEHAPWPLRSARVTRLEETVVQSAGLPAPRRKPLVHFSPCVDVRVGPPIPL
jgi:uncharacterized protein YqjF (DUF2071 family)